MRTNEFKARINALGFEMKESITNGRFFTIKSVRSRKTVADFFADNNPVFLKDFYTYNAFTELEKDTQVQLFNLLELYTQTPLDEREELSSIGGAKMTNQSENKIIINVKTTVDENDFERAQLLADKVKFHIQQAKTFADELAKLDIKVDFVLDEGELKRAF